MEMKGQKAVDNEKDQESKDRATFKKFISRSSYSGSELDCNVLIFSRN